MSATSIRRMLNGTTIAMVGLTLASVAWVLAPALMGGLMNAPADPNDLLVSGHLSPSEMDPTESLSAADDPIWSRRLRGGFAVQSSRRKTRRPRPPAPETRQITKPNPASDAGLTLVGTVLEEGQSVAIFSDRSGTLDFCRVGERLTLKPLGVTIESIRDREVIFDFQGQPQMLSIGQTWLAKPRPANPSGAQSNPTDQATPVEAKKSNIDDVDADASPKMSIEDELDFLNGIDHDF